MEIIEKIMNSKKIPYNRLGPLVEPYIKGIPELSNINIYIDIYSLLKQLYNPEIIDNINNIKQSEKLVISSHIINMISHYRHYFASRHKLYTTFYLYMSNRKCDYLTNIEPEYRHEFYEKRFNLEHPVFGRLNQLINTNFKVSKTVIEYIPHAYFINTGEFEPSVVPFALFDRIKTGTLDEPMLSILITNDEKSFQDLTTIDNLIILQTKAENSRVISQDNVIDVMLEKAKNVDNIEVSYELIPIIQMIVNNKDYNTKGIRNMGNSRAIKFLQKCLNQHLISNLNYTPELFINEIGNELKEGEAERILKNHSIINNKDIFNNNISGYKFVLEKNIFDKNNPEDLKKINNQYFAKFPILLDFAFED